MSTLTLQRCLHHGEREAVARCLECGHFFCRECIAEHDERVVCAACIARLTRRDTTPARRLRLAALRPWLGAFTGLLVAWLFFYCIGRVLLALPSDIHASALWDGTLLDSQEEAP